VPEGEPHTKPIAEDAAHFPDRQVHAPRTRSPSMRRTAHEHRHRHLDRSAPRRTRPGIGGDGRKPQRRKPMTGIRDQPAARVQFLVRPGGGPHHAARSLAAHRRDHGGRVHQGHVHRGHAGRDFQVPQSGRPIHRKNSQERYYLWDELAACAWLDPGIITQDRELYMDVDVSHGPAYGETLTWSAALKPVGLRWCTPRSTSTCRGSGTCSSN